MQNTNAQSECGRRHEAPSRRAFLRASCGVSSGLVLPWLGSLRVRGEDTGKQVFAEAIRESPPMRFGCLFFSNGVEPAHWWTKTNGDKTEYGPGLKPLEKYAQDITFLNGLFNNQAASHPSPHMGRMANLLSGAWVSRDQNEIRVGRSMDQVLAESLGTQTEIPSLVLGVEPTELRLEDGLSMIYGSCISWASETKPATKEIYPARVYDQIVGGAGDRQLDQSVLDEVREDAQQLRHSLSASDRRKLDEYLESIRGIETRIERASKSESLEGWQPSASQPTFIRPNEALPQDVPEHMRLMLDLIVLAFQMDKTRIATCMLNNDLSQMNFGFLEGVEGSLHLDLTHNGRDPKLEAMYLRTNQFHCSQFEYLMSRMKSIDEGGTSLWDNSILLFASNLFDGDRHQADHMPMLLSGGAGGALRHGREINVREAGDENRQACGLYLSIMDLMGVQLPKFGDATKRFAIT